MEQEQQQSLPEFDSDAALDKEWHDLNWAHIALQAASIDDPTFAEKLAEVIAKLQAYGRVLRRTEKEVDRRKLGQYKKGVLLPASSIEHGPSRLWENVD